MNEKVVCLHTKPCTCMMLITSVTFTLNQDSDEQFHKTFKADSMSGGYALSVRTKNDFETVYYYTLSLIMTKSQEKTTVPVYASPPNIIVQFHKNIIMACLYVTVRYIHDF